MSQDIVVDTHVLIWIALDPSKLGKKATAVLSHRDTCIYVSVVSAIEIAQLCASKRLSLSTPADRWFAQALEVIPATLTPLTAEIVFLAYELPLHRDPADRMLAATAMSLNVPLLTADSRLLACRSIRTVNAAK
jgi:PIN domain nuclease of toxin-antitoxin system